jgi:aryl-alcohol dehydrogenase (NADP+)
VKQIADGHGVSASQVALRWLGDRPAVTSVILGARTVEQLRDNMAATNLVLSADEAQRLTEASTPRVDDYPYGTAGVAQRDRSLSGSR